MNQTSSEPVKKVIESVVKNDDKSFTTKQGVLYECYDVLLQGDTTVYELFREPKYAGKYVRGQEVEVKFNPSKPYPNKISLSKIKDDNSSPQKSYNNSKSSSNSGGSKYWRPSPKHPEDQHRINYSAVLKRSAILVEKDSHPGALSNIVQFLLNGMVDFVKSKNLDAQKTEWMYMLYNITELEAITNILSESKLTKENAQLYTQAYISDYFKDYLTSKGEEETQKMPELEPSFLDTLK